MPGEGELSTEFDRRKLTTQSFPFGWLFLPVDLIGRPFSQKTRDHFLPLLTSTAWWSETQMALKRVFQVDVDFQPRMFAKQIAVMKGQAWNVVEALKTPDHGPLELTRRTKVCVWDDLVDVPVAVPMRVTSSEMDRNGTAARESMDEADIASSAPADPRHLQDLLGPSSVATDMPHPGRFEITTPGESGPPSPEMSKSDPDGALAYSPEREDGSSARNVRPTGPQKSYFASYHGSGRALNIYDPARQQPNADQQDHRQRRYSFAKPPIRRSSTTAIAQHLYGDNPHDGYDGDDIAGDLGYAAAEGQMGNQRKVIVERLEAVKSRNPVFTWC